MTDYTELIAADAERTQGVWRTVTVSSGLRWEKVLAAIGGQPIATFASGTGNEADATFIALCSRLVPELLAERDLSRDASTKFADAYRAAGVRITTLQDEHTALLNELTSLADVVDPDVLSAADIIRRLRAIVDQHTNQEN